MNKVHHLSSLMIVRSLDGKKTHFVLMKMVKNYLVLKYHILVSLVYLYILLVVLAQVLLFSSIYWLGTVILQPKDIGMVSSIYCATSKEQLIWVYFSQRNQSSNCLDILM